MDKPETPVQEAMSLISITAILIGVGSYVACLQNTPLASPALFWVAQAVYHCFPALNAMAAPQMPYLVASGTVGCVFFVLTVPFAGLLASWMAQAGIAGIERSTIKLQKARTKIRKRRRDRDGFSAE
ncbi:MAG: hypothetical protein JO279_02225 [Verrucomicrobia bacterium]|nr:hypothetical protein [Verrucomicrobiota bacterium]MBV8375797.1 hypothetical protein [Verrucomicrobiota bacterium]